MGQTGSAQNDNTQNDADKFKMILFQYLAHKIGQVTVLDGIASSYIYGTEATLQRSNLSG